MRRVWLKTVLAMCIAGILSACAGQQVYGTAPGMVVTELSALPRPSQTPSFTLQPFDSVEISVLQDDTLSGTYVIDADGLLTFPLIGGVNAAGLTTAQLSRRLVSGLANGYILDPDVNLRTTEPRNFSFSIGGEITKPGSYPLQTANTLLRGVNTAGGLTDFAKVDDVLIMRTVDDQNYIGAYNLGAIRRGNYPDPQLAPGDVVMVGDSPNQRRLTALLPYLSLITTGAVVISQLVR